MKSFWLHTSWFTYSQNGSLWLQWELSYFFVFIPEASKAICKHEQYPQYIPNSTLQCCARVHSRSTALQHFYKWPIIFHKRHTASKFCDYDSIGTSWNSVDDLITELQKESENAIDWFCSNKMVVNPDKIQSIISNRLEKFKNYYKLLIDNHKIDLENSITLSGIETDNKLNFEKHVTALCQKPSHQLNALSCIHKYTGFQEMKILLCSFIFSSFNYCPLVWDFCPAPLAQKIEKIQERALRLFHNDRYPSYNSLLLKAEQSTMEVSCSQD